MDPEEIKDLMEEFVLWYGESPQACQKVGDVAIYHGTECSCQENEDNVVKWPLNHIRELIWYVKLGRGMRAIPRDTSQARQAQQAFSLYVKLLNDRDGKQ